MEHFYIITNRDKDQELTVTGRIRDYLTGRGKQCTVKDRQSGGGDYSTDPASIPDDVDCILVLGGDGTMLQAARDVAPRQIPILGINLGTLGYLAEIDMDNLENALEVLLQGSYVTEKRMMLQGTVMHADGSVDEDTALNDIVITRSGNLRVILYEIYVNGQFLKGYSADGLILSTPTGSTGYNMSAGGPIVEPSAELIMLTPICPHTLNTRGIILSPQDEIEVKIGRGRDGANQEIMVNFDGGHAIGIRTGDRIRISRWEKYTNILKCNHMSFLEVLHRKMKDA